MIQATFSSGANIDNFIYLRLTDVGSASNGVRPLISIKSQQTEKVYNFMAGVVTMTNQERYTQMSYTIGTLDLPIIGFLILGTTDYPFGFYDVTIYQNSTNANLDPTGLTIKLYTGLLNLRSLVNPTQYKSYTINDSDTDSVYITL